MKKKNYPKGNFNPEIINENLVMHLDAARPAKKYFLENDENEFSAFWKDWNFKITDLNSPLAVWNDLSGNGIDGVLSHFGHPKRVWDLETLAFRGSFSDYVEVAADGKQKFANPQFSIEVWASVVLGGNKPLFAYDQENGIPCANLRLNDAKCRFTFRIDGATKVLDGNLPDDFDSGEINQFVCTFKDGEQNIYINNKKIASAKYKGSIEYSDTPVYIGRSPALSNDARLIGEVATVRYYKQVLSAAEVEQNYIAGTGEIILPVEYINVKDVAYGAKGDGVTDDTAAIQRALDAAANYVVGSDDEKDKNGNYVNEKAIAKKAAGGGNVYIPPGIYMIDASKAVELRSNTNLYMHGKATLQAQSNRLIGYTILGIRHVENVGVYGGNIRGERNEHKGTQGQWGMGVSIIKSRNIRIEGTRADECWGDGFYIGTDTNYSPVAASREKYIAPEDVYLIDVKADRNRRQGITIVSGRNIEFIRPLMTNTGGFGDPEAGIDIEPDNNTHIIENIYIEDAITKNNGGAGILVYLRNLLKISDPNMVADKNISIIINGHYDNGSQYGLFVQDKGVVDQTGKYVVTGNLKINDCVWESAREKSLCINDHLVHLDKSDKPRVYKIEVNNCMFKNLMNNLGSPYDSAHLRLKSPIKGGVIGNIFICNPTFCDDLGRSRAESGRIYELSRFDYSKDIVICTPQYQGSFLGYETEIEEYHKSFINEGCESCNKEV